MRVECYDPEGQAVYEMILRHIIQEVQVTRSIKDAWIYVDPREPVFIIIIQMQKTAAPLLLDDMATYKWDKEANEVSIRLKDEKYLPALLQKLWEVEGRNKVHQPSRLEVIVDDPKISLEGMVVQDPHEDLKKKVYDAIFRIIPEGFRVIEHYSEGDIIVMTCSDELIKEEYLEKTKEFLKEFKEEVSQANSPT